MAAYHLGDPFHCLEFSHSDRGRKCCTAISCSCLRLDRYVGHRAKTEFRGAVTKTDQTGSPCSHSCAKAVVHSGVAAACRKSPLSSSPQDVGPAVAAPCPSN